MKVWHSIQLSWSEQDLVKEGAQAVGGYGVPGEWVDYPYGRPLRD